MKYLSSLVLDGLHLHVMWRILPLADPHRPLEALETVESDGVSPGVEEVAQLLHQTLAAVEEARGEPEQFPAPLVTSSDGIVCQLLHDLAVDLVPQYFLRHMLISKSAPPQSQLTCLSGPVKIRSVSSRPTLDCLPGWSPM